MKVNQLPKQRFDLEAGQLVSQSDVPHSAPPDLGTKDIASRPQNGTTQARMADLNEQALQEIIEVHGVMLQRLIGRLTGWHADRDDILQDVLLTVWKQADKYVERGSRDAWLRRIVLNRVRNHFRYLARMRRRLLALVPQSVTVPATCVQEHNNEPLHIAIRQLSESDRLMIVLFHLEELPGEQVAELMGMKLANLHVRLHRARQRLKAILESRGEKHE
ncbi:MAG: RNA polymerase sigma factor [Pirellulaceae bacterium]